MAWLQSDPSGNHHVCFRFGGKKFKRSLRTKDRKKAQRKLVRLEETVDLIQMGRIELPSSVDIPTFLLSDGKLKVKHKIDEQGLVELFVDFFDAIPEGSLLIQTAEVVRVLVFVFWGQARFQLSQLSTNITAKCRPDRRIEDARVWTVLFSRNDAWSEFGIATIRHNSHHASMEPWSHGNRHRQSHVLSCRISRDNVVLNLNGVKDGTTPINRNIETVTDDWFSI